MGSKSKRKRQKLYHRLNLKNATIVLPTSIPNDLIKIINNNISKQEKKAIDRLFKLSEKELETLILQAKENKRKEKKQ